MKAHLYTLLKAVIGWPLTLVALYFIGNILLDQAPAVTPHLKSIDLLLLIYGTSCFVIFYFLRSLIWHRMMKIYNAKLTYKESTYLWSISELKRYIPGSVWSFLGRSVLFNKKGIEKKQIARGLIFEAEIFVIGCFVVSLLSLPFFLPYNTSLLSWAICLFVVVGCLIYAYNRFVIVRSKATWQSSSRSKSTSGLLHFVRNDAVEYLFPPFPAVETLRLLAISVVALLFFGFGNYFVMTSVFLTDPRLVLQLVGVFSIAFVMGYLSILTPAGLGVREGIIIFALSKIIPTGLAATAAIFTRIMLIVSEVLFIVFCTLWHRFRSQKLLSLEQWIAARPHGSVVVAMSVLYTIYITTISFLRFDNFYTGRFDLGNMVQTVWNTLHGNLFMLTDPNGTENVSRLAFHADFILVLLAPLYALWQDPRMLLLIQTVVVAAGAIFVYLIAYHVLRHKTLSVVLAFSYLINPSVERANLYDFHAVTLATTFLLAAFYFFLKKNYVAFMIAAVLAAFCKEQIWLIVALFGPLLFFYHKKRLFGTAIFIIGLGAFYTLLWHGIPNALGSQHFALEYYADYGDSPSKIVQTILLSPDKIVLTILEPDRMQFIRQLLSPLGYLPLLFPFFLIFAGPDLLISLLSNNAQLHQIYYQYTATITPFLFLSAIYGIWVIMSLGKTKQFQTNVLNSFIGSYIIVTSLYAAYSFGPLPWSKEPNLHMITKPFPNRDQVTHYLQRIPTTEKIAASNNIASHLSQREHIYVTPLGVDKADLIILDIHDLQAKATIEKIAKDKSFIKTFEKDGLVEYRRK